MEKSSYTTECRICGHEGIFPYAFCQKHLPSEQKVGAAVHRFDRSTDPTTDTSGTYKVGQTVLVCVGDLYRTGDIIRIVGDMAVVHLAGGTEVERELKSLVNMRASTLERARRGADREKQ